jgi:ABC-2 type transport system ATP-binding protein
VLSSHLLVEVEQVCNRATILARGRRQWEGAVDELLAPRRRIRLRATPVAAARALIERAGGAVDDRGGGLLHVRGGDPPLTPAALVDRLVTAGIAVDEIAAEAPTLEEVFVSLVDQADGDGADRGRDSHQAASATSASASR